MTVNPHLEREPVAAGPELAQARMAAVLVHGRDQDEQVMLDVVGRLALPDVAYLLPVAAGNVWYPGRYFDPLPANAPWVAWSLDALDAAIARARAGGVAEERIVVAGFSQGGCLVAELVARRPRRLAGAAVLTGTLMGPDGEETRPDPVDGLPMFFGASRYDEWVRIERVHASAQAFERAGARVTVETYEDREHLINDDAVAGVRRLLADARTGA
ncbi:MAG TPA: dienelactone hydrolase family protein [Solirubrobacteraceae bacterium]|nr:dienelactone hydrolase family protein [Solirubrobacteraceae bacterium]